MLGYFEIKENMYSTNTTDFVVLVAKVNKVSLLDMQDLRDQLTSLPCVRDTSMNKKISASYSSFLNLHDSFQQSVFKTGINGDGRSYSEEKNESQKLKRELFLKGDYSNLHDELELWNYHNNGFTGKGIKIAIFDSGISAEASKYLNIAAKVDFTGDSEEQDSTSHGTFIASVIGSKNER